MRLFSTEQVTKYHPDKLCDQISDAILDACLAQDPDSHVACECMAKGETIILAGEITTTAKVNYAGVASRVCAKLGYKASNVLTYIEQQSPEIASGVGNGDDQGAGDQGMMYGYATAETASKLPFGFNLANRITARLEKEVAEPDAILKGDAKVQVTVDADEMPDFRSIKKILVSACHKEGIDFNIVKAYLETLVWSEVDRVVDGEATRKHLRKTIEIIINPAGPWTIGGPSADCGLTGRKIVCDQYGGYCPVGGGAFSGKDPSKVDRSGAYMARKIACDLLDEYKLKWCEVQIAYAIGQAEPVSVSVKCDQPINLGSVVSARYDLSPAGIIKTLNLKRPIYEKLSGGCHFREV